MSAPINTGGPAFPSGLESGHMAPLHNGMNLRDYFAAAALPAIISAIDRHNSLDPERAKGEGFCADDGDQQDAIDASVEAYIVADHMLAARDGGAA